MPTITLNKNVFEKLVGKKLALNELKDRISMLGTDLESVDGKDINVEIFPNRPDMLSEQGFARAFSSFIGVKTGLREYPVSKSDARIIIDKSVQKYRPCSAAAIVKGVSFTDELIREIMQNQEKIHKTFGRDRKKVALGYYILDKIKFPLKYTAQDPHDIKFKPLHFDKEINGLQILSKHPTGREFACLLEGFDKYPVYYDSAGKVLSMPPIINSDEAGNILPGVSDVLVECTGFDQEVLNKAIAMSVATLADMGGQICSVQIIYPSGKKVIVPDMSPGKMSIDPDYVNKILGLSLKLESIIKLLSKMGYGYEQKSKKVLIPAYRTDILHQIDLIEDIAIAYGYENFQETIPRVATIGEEDGLESLKRRISELLIGLNMVELYTYNIANSNSITSLFLGPRPILLANSLSEDFDCLRSTMLSSIMESLAKNRKNEYPQSIFDIGTIFKKSQSEETGVKERDCLAAALCAEGADFTRIKQVLDFIFKNLDVQYSLREVNNPSFIEGRSAEIYLAKSYLGIIGEISPQVLANFGVEYPLSCFELDLSELFNLI
jgi:phenylalanyl-tRNA synthetase beta chain